MLKHTFKRGAIFFAAVLTLMPVLAQADTATDAQIVHLLNRVSFGPAPGDVEMVRKMGIEAYLYAQLHPQSIALPPELQNRLSSLRTTNMPVSALMAEFAMPRHAKSLPPEEKKAINKKQREIVSELIQAKILRAVASPAQLQEVMTDFWFNHFNVFTGKGPVKLLVGSYERDAIRPSALGNFRELLEATARHPAMLVYLDNWQNTDPNSPLAQKTASKTNKRPGINENYAREVMELHTLGVNGGYTQNDVTTLAHILTGWGLERGHEAEDKATFFFDAERHDASDKVFLGQPFAGGGTDEIERALDILAYHPSTAKHISYELAQYFVSDTPPQALVDKLADTFQKTHGDISRVLDTLFHAPEFWDAKSVRAKFKPPFRYAVSALRATGVMPPDGRGVYAAITQMGQRLYYCLTPNGYPNTNDQWYNSDAVLKRINFAKMVGSFYRRHFAGNHSGRVRK